MLPDRSADAYLPAPSEKHPAPWAGTFAELANKWQTLAASELADTRAWQQRFTEMRATQDQLQQQGRWVRGPADLMSVCGVHRRELAHSSALRWLCDSAGSHGLGDTFLELLLAAIGEPLEVDADAEAVTEVGRERSRADLVVYGDQWTLVAELKIDAAESQEQCQRLFEDWRTDPGVQLVFITLSGRAPVTARTAEAVQAWHALSWADILDVLAEAVRTRVVEVPAVAEYRRTLRRLVGRR